MSKTDALRIKTLQFYFFLISYVKKELTMARETSVPKRIAAAKKKEKMNFRLET